MPGQFIVGTRRLLNIGTGRHFISGLGSGLATAVTLQPLDLLKTRVQQSGRKSVFVLLRQMRQEPGFLPNLWRGTVPSALRTGCGSALYFTTLNHIRQYMSESAVRGRQNALRRGSSVLPTLNNSANLVSGALARAFAGLVLMPLTVIKVRFESNLYTYSSLQAASRNIYHVDGLRGFFAGFGATAMRDAPYAGMYVLFYEMFKTRLSTAASDTFALPRKAKMQSAAANTVNFASAALAATICSVISNPFDTVKTRIQLQPQSYRNLGQAALKMMKEDGFGAFWDGLALRMTRKTLSSALAWTLYEELIRRSEAS
jgi:solute carrier family 25 protein 38